MKIVILTFLLLTGCTPVTANNDISINNENSFKEDSKVVSPRHIIITFTKTHKCVISIELPKETPIDQFMEIVFIKRQECLETKVKTKVRTKNPKILVDL